MPKFTIGGDIEMATVLGLFQEEGQAKKAIEKMKETGISEDKISLVAKHNEQQDIEAGDEITNAQQNLTDGAATGGALGGVAGILAGAGLLAIPGLGPILAAGPIAAGLSGVAAGGITGGLVDYGLDQKTGEKYGKEVESGGILVAAEDTDQSKINDIASILRESEAYDVATH